MTDEQLSRAIAEFLEPKPIPYRWNDSANFPCKVSEIGVWVFPVVHDGSVKDAKPRDMVHDPSMTVMLWQKLLRQGIGFTSSGWDREKQEWTHIHSEGLQGYPSVVWPMEQVGRAVVEVFAKANGIWKD